MASTPIDFYENSAEHVLDSVDVSLHTLRKAVTGSVVELETEP
jgi:hypothetical protein